MTEPQNSTPDPNPPDIASLFDPPPEMVAETHISVIYLCGDTAWKLKKAVVLPYVDFGSLEKRRAACAQEVALNRRTAPQIYRGVRAVYRSEDGRLSFTGKGAPVEWLVEMQRFDASQTFDHLVKGDALTPQIMESLAEAIARFHAKASLVDMEADAALALPLRVNAAAFARLDAEALPAEDVSAYQAALDTEVEKQKPVLATRRAAGRVRRGHGDLHLRNIVLIDGQPVLFDCLEFDEALASGDTMYDIAFLLMDLLEHDRRDLANRVLNRYLEVAGDYGGLVLLPLYLAVRAAVRCHIAGLKRETWREARHYLALARAVLRPRHPHLIAIGGLSGTGKSTIARRLAPGCGDICGAVVLRSDVIRKGLHGKSHLERLPKEAYTAEASRRTYAAMLDQAGKLLRGGTTVILDAVFGRADERAAVAALARECGAGFDGFWLEAPLECLAARIKARRNDASDATVEVLQWQAEALASPEAAEGWRRLDAGGTADAIAGRAATLLTKPAA